MAEAGVPDLDVRLWSGLFAPAATPAGIVKKLEKELMEIVKLPDVQRAPEGSGGGSGRQHVGRSSRA